ncbi:MAG: hypothetical protein J0H43_12630 [Actinobacteria bacterium]|nr:hypothetical protein [Actinomycetota bacterium]
MREVRGRRPAPALALVLLAVVLAACASGGHGGAGPRTAAGSGSASGLTQVRTFAAYSSAGTLTVPVSTTEQGNCWTTSIAVAAPGAYRCFAGNDILDPCFAAPGSATASQSAEVACVSAPWAKAVVLELTSDLPAATGEAAAARPWAFELANGARCVASTGTVPEVAGVNLEYQCAGGYGASLDNATAAKATARYAKIGAATVTSVAVTTIWRS